MNVHADQASTRLTSLPGQTSTSKAIVLVGALLFSVAGLAKDGPHDKAIKARQALMQVYSFNMGILSAMAKEKAPYDAGAASDAAANLLAAVSMKQGPLWPQGSDSENKDNRKNRALAAIWTTYPKVSESGEAMLAAATSMNAAAGDGLDSLKGAMGDLGKGCKGCHDDFRAKKKK